MPISWNEIKTRAIAFSKEWEDESSEDAEAKSFWDDFFNVFGISRRRVASFEKPVKKQDGKQGFIDLLWKGVILVEHKSRGRNLDKAAQQAKDYFPGLKEHELPKYILVSDFQKFRLYDLDNETKIEFQLREFVQNVHLFGFIAGYEKRVYKEQDPANIQAAERMGKLHDALEESGYQGHPLEVYLVRLLFCLFAEDTGIFERTQFQEYIDQNTKEDGSDLAPHLAQLFQTLNTPIEKRFNTLDENLKTFPYVNGKLFEEMLPLAAFNSKMRELLLYACSMNWSGISPAIFGSMFQAAMKPKERRNLGAHYTSEKNIQKVIKPLFLDNLYVEFNKAKGNKNKLQELHKKMAMMHFLDPACGCGNFLIIAYKELRLLEIEILRELNKIGQSILNFNLQDILLIDVHQFTGIEYDEFAVRIAEVAMWLIDHQMNLLVSQEFGQYYARLPLKKSAKIVCENALQIKWESIIPANELSYILGNPPFIGKQLQTDSQKKDMMLIFNKVKGGTDLDYVAAWFYKAAEFIKNTSIEVGFVSTNSISQGEQVPLLWNPLLNDFKIKINFAHRTFKWKNEAKGVAAVHCTITGFANFDRSKKQLFECGALSEESHDLTVNQINPYLSPGPVLLINKRSTPICETPKMIYGNKPTDDGNFIFTDEEKLDFLNKEPKAEKYFKKYIGSAEFINNISRWCLWLKDADPSDLKKLPHVMDRINKVKAFREKSTAAPTRKSALTPYLFFYISQPLTNYLVIPETSSEKRDYIPIGYISKEVIASNALYLIPEADLYTFGVVCSKMHMAWMRTVGGRLKSDYRYSGSIVYNTFPFPQNVSELLHKKVEQAAQSVLEVREKYPNSSLSDLYDPLTMPPDLVKSHQSLDRAVDMCYRQRLFDNEVARIEYLFGLYEQYNNPMFQNNKKGRKK